jgi:PAS domain S-box-containing protein
MTEISSEYLDRVLNALNEAVFVYDQNMEICHFNEAAEKITGFRRREVVGKKCITLFDSTLCLNNCTLCATARKGPMNGRVSFESPFIRKDGIRRQGRFQAGLLKQEEDGTVQVLVALTDISEIVTLREQLRGDHAFQNLIGKSPPMRDLFQTIKNVAAFDTTALLQGESGTGKELVARAIHSESPRRAAPFIVVNCAVFSDNLLESEIFGHAKGAFTGAVSDRVGRFEESHGGTVFLDEIAEVAPRVQVKLLRVLQEKEIERVGSSKVRKVDLRIIAASNKNLEGEVKAGRFREDLFYRLNVVPLHLPPLRDRREDIPDLARHFLARWTAANGKTISNLSSAAVGALMDHDWPGNVRELENAVEHACVKCSTETVHLDDLPASIPRRPAGRAGKRRNTLTRENILEALARSGNHQTRAAQLLDVHRITLWRQMKRFGLTG